MGGDAALGKTAYKVPIKLIKPRCLLKTNSKVLQRSTH